MENDPACKEFITSIKLSRPYDTRHSKIAIFIKLYAVINYNKPRGKEWCECLQTDNNQLYNETSNLLL